MYRKDCEQHAETQWNSRMLKVCGALTVLLLLLLAVTSVAAEASPSGAGPMEVRLRSYAVLEDEAVRLSDVATLQGGATVQRSALDGVVVARLAPGGQMTISIDDLTARLTQVGANLADVLLVGSACCRVQRAGQVSDDSSVKAGSSGLESTARGETLRHRLTQYLVEQAGALPGRIDVQFDRSSLDALNLSEPEYQFRVRRCRGEGLGMIALEVEILRQGQSLQRLPILASVTAEVSVVVARQAISQNSPISDRDVMLESRRFDRVDKIGLTDLGAVVGQQAERLIRRGQELSIRDIKPMPLVKRGDIVTVTLSRGGFVIRAAAKSLQGGAYGDLIEVRGSGSKESFMARVAGLRVVEVDG